MRGCNSLKEVGAFLILSKSIQERNNHQHHRKLIIPFCIFCHICLCRFVITAAHCLYDVVEGNPSKQVSWGCGSRFTCCVPLSLPWNRNENLSTDKLRRAIS